MKHNLIKSIFILLFIFVGIFYSKTVFAYLPPIANAGPNQYINSNSSVVLQGAGYDQNGTTVNYSWSCAGGSVSNPFIAQPTYTLYSNTTQNTSYLCTLTVTNGYGLSATSTTTVFVNSINSNNFQVQTNPATSVNYTQAVLNATISSNTVSGNSAWFQWGTNNSYGYESFHQFTSNSSNFSQPIANLIPNTTYHFRALGEQNNGQIIYGQDQTFYTNPNPNNQSTNNSNTAIITKQGINLTSGNLNWSNYMSAKPSDILKFQITIQAPNQSLNNVVVKDILPANLTYNYTTSVSGATYAGDIMSGLSLATIAQNQTITITYQAQVAPDPNFAFGTTILNNSVSLQSSQTGPNNALSNVIISVTKTNVLGAATSVSTGLTNNPLTDSFFLPLLLLIAGFWIYKSRLLHSKK